MYLKQTAVAAALIVLISTGCSKKQHPQTAANKTPETKAVENKPVAKKVKMPAPKVITVDDRAAKKNT